MRTDVCMQGGEHAGKMKAYIGESHRSIVTRSRSHFELYKQTNKRTPGSESMSPGDMHMDCLQDSKAGSWMKEHTMKEHGGVISGNKQDDYGFYLLGSHRKPLTRQLQEAVLMDKVERTGRLKVGRDEYKVGRELLNSKFEFYRPRSVQINGR